MADTSQFGPAFDDFVSEVESAVAIHTDERAITNAVASGLTTLLASSFFYLTDSLVLITTAT